MKISKLIASAFALTLLFNISCRNEDNFEEAIPKGAYENGILITNEGGFSTPTASVSYFSNDFAKQEDNIFKTNNGNAVLGNVFQSVGFKGDLAYLVLNVPNKVEIVNRYTFKKTNSITSNLSTPRYIAFANNHTYITNNDYAERITSSSNYIYIQTDGSTYDASYNELPTGHTITRINPLTNEVDKVITLNDNFIIKDMTSDANFVYVLTSNDSTSNFYKIAASTGIAEKISFENVAGGLKLAIDQNKIYMISSAKKVFNITGNTANELFSVTANNIYGFNVINGNVFVADPTFSSDSKTRIYSLTGTLLKTLTTGIGTNGFYKN